MARPNKPRYLKSRDSWVTKIDGQQHTLAKGKQNRREAERALGRLLEARDAGKVMVRPRDVGLLGLADAFLDYKKKTVGDLTWEFYRRHLAAFLAFVGRKRLASSITEDTVLDWLAAPKSIRRRSGVVALPPWSPSTRHGAIVALKAAFAWAVKNKHLAESPIRHMKGPGIRQRQSVLDESAVRRILDVARGEFRDMLEFMWETGCRPSEAMNLEARHVKSEAGVVEMRSKTSRGEAEDRTIYLTARSLEILREKMAVRPSGYLFRSARGNQWHRHAMAAQFARIRRKLGLGPDGTAEAIRHAFGTDGALRLPPMVLARLMGHTSTAMVSKYYAHLDRRGAEMTAALRTIRPDDTKDT